MAKIPILKAGAAPPKPKDTCLNCRFNDPGMLPGATKVLCMRYPRTELKRTSDWCGEFQIEPAS